MSGRSYSQMNQLLAAAAATGVSTDVIQCAGLAQVAVQIDGNGSTYGATIQFQASLEGSDWFPVQGVEMSSGDVGLTAVNSTSLYTIPVAGYSGFRVEITAYTDGAVNVWARGIAEGGPITVADVDVAFSGDSLGIDEIGAEAVLADGTANPTIGSLASFGFVFNGTTWDRLLGDTTRGIRVAPHSTTYLYVDAQTNNPSVPADEASGVMVFPTYQHVFNGTTWDRVIGDTVEGLRVHEATADTVILPADGLAAPVLLPKNLSFPMVFNGTTWDRAIGDTVEGLRVHEATADTVILPADGMTAPVLLPKQLSFPMFFNGTTWDRAIGDTVEGLRIHEATADTVILPADSMAAPVLVPKYLSFPMGLNDSGSYDRLRVDDAFRLRVSQDWNSTLQVFETTGDIDNDFAVPAGLEWHVMWIHVELITGTNVGARQIAVQIQDSADDIIANIFSGVTQAASLTYQYHFYPGAPDLTAVRSTDNWVSTPLPGGLILPELFSVRVFDAALIDNGAPSSDDMQVQMMVMDRTRSDT